MTTEELTKPRSGYPSIIPAADIAALLAERAERLCRELLPAGRRVILVEESFT